MVKKDNNYRTYLEFKEGKKLRDFKFVNELEIEINYNESIVLPFRYVIDKDKAIISEKLVEYLRKRGEF